MLGQHLNLVLSWKTLINFYAAYSLSSECRISAHIREHGNRHNGQLLHSLLPWVFMLHTFPEPVLPTQKQQTNLSFKVFYILFKTKTSGCIIFVRNNHFLSTLKSGYKKSKQNRCLTISLNSSFILIDGAEAFKGFILRWRVDLIGNIQYWVSVVYSTVK